MSEITTITTITTETNEHPILTRRRMLTLGAMGAVAAALATVPHIALAQSPQQDLDILNYALTLEHLEARAYKEANASGLLSGDAAKYFQMFGQHEADHVTALTDTINKLGGMPVAAQASYNFPAFANQDELLKYFQMVEELGAAAYLGQAPRIQSPDILTAAVSIHNVEGQHAAVLSDLIGVSPAPDFAKPKTMEQVLAVVGPILGTPQSNPPANTPMTMPTTGADMALPTIQMLLGGLGLLGGGGYLLRRFGIKPESEIESDEIK